MLKKTVIAQFAIGKELSLEQNLLIFRQRPDFVVLPEYYNVDPVKRDAGHNSIEAINRLRLCRILAERLDTTLVAGTSIESKGNRFYNACHIFDRAEERGVYRKINPTPGELKNDISPGENFLVLTVDNVRIAILICADVLNSENFDALRPLKPDIVFVPTISPYKKETIRDKISRDNSIFVDGARRCQAYVVKCCAVGNLWGNRLQGRSLFAAPWGVLSRIPHDDEDKNRILSLILDIAEIREFRQKQIIISN